MVERRPHPEDRRAIRVCLTGRGLAHAKEINTIMVKANKAFMSKLEPEQSAQFRKLIKQVAA